MSSEHDTELTLIAAWTDKAAIDLLERALPAAAHLKPLWERLVVWDAGDRVAIGLPVPSRLNDDNFDNHARHVYSLFNVLGLPLVASPMGLERVEVPTAQTRSLYFDEDEARRLRQGD